MSKEDKTDIPPEKPKMIGIPTQKTFIFSGRNNAARIDAVVNPWLQQQSLKGQAAMLIKMEFVKSIFGSRVYAIYMFNQPHELPKK